MKTCAVGRFHSSPKPSQIMPNYAKLCECQDPLYNKRSRWSKVTLCFSPNRWESSVSAIVKKKVAYVLRFRDPKSLGAHSGDRSFFSFAYLTWLLRGHFLIFAYLTWFLRGIFLYFAKVFLGGLGAPIIDIQMQVLCSKKTAERETPYVDPFWEDFGEAWGHRESIYKCRFSVLRKLLNEKHHL